MTEEKKEMRITDAELSWIKNTFAGNDMGLKIFRKIFFPEIKVETPIGQQVDLWMTIPLEDLTPEEALINIKARNSLIQHVEQCLVQLKVLAGLKEETVEQTVERLKKNSSK